MVVNSAKDGRRTLEYEKVEKEWAREFEEWEGVLMDVRKAGEWGRKERVSVVFLSKVVDGVEVNRIRVLSIRYFVRLETKVQQCDEG